MGNGRGLRTVIIGSRPKVFMYRDIEVGLNTKDWDIVGLKSKNLAQRSKD